MSKPRAEAASDTKSATRTSQSLIQRAKQNDTDAWERIVQLYSPLVYHWCKESGLPEPDLRDIFQEVFYTLARSLDKFRPAENGTFRGWLRTMTRNKVTDHFRRSGREPCAVGGTAALHYIEQFPNSPQPAAAASVTDSATETHSEEVDIQQSMLCQALDNVRPNFTQQTWNAFWMVVMDGRETNDVAKDLSMRPGTVRVAKSRVLKRLRLEIGDAIE